MALTFPASWIHGSEDCRNNEDPPIQVHQTAPGTFILRQNKCVHFEAPFIYLLIGDERAILVDTGATASPDQFPLAATVDRLLDDHTRDRGLESLPQLIVAHTHGHGDHFAADAQFQGRPNTQIVQTRVHSVSEFFGIDSWPEETATLDLGGRTIRVIPVPGHLVDDIAIYDEAEQILLSGDTFYPGRLFIRDWQTYRASIGRLHRFAATSAVQFVLGAHIEMTNQPGVAFPQGSINRILTPHFSTTQILGVKVPGSRGPEEESGHSRP